MAMLTSCLQQVRLSPHQELEGVALTDICSRIHEQMLIVIRFFLPLFAYGILFL